MKSDNTENKLDLAPAEAEEGEIPAVAAAPELPKQKKSKKKLILIAVIVVVVLFLLSRMLGGGSGIPMGGNYTAEAAAHRDLSVTVSGTGTIQPIHSSTIVGMVTGDILSDSFEIGDAVEKDQVLYTIDAEAAQTAVEQAQLALQQAQIAYEQASRAAQDLTVSSTVSGQVSSVEVKKGDAVSAGTAVVTVTDNKNMTIKCNFNSADAKNIRAGQSGTVTITSTGETVAATVSNVSAYTAVGAGGPAASRAVWRPQPEWALMPARAAAPSSMRRRPRCWPRQAVLWTRFMFPRALRWHPARSWFIWMARIWPIRSKTRS